MQSQSTNQTFAGKINVKWLPEVSGGLIEIYREGWQCAFLGLENCQAHKLSTCKDFLAEVVRSHLYGINQAIYGFQYDSNTAPKLNLSVSFSDHPTKKKKGTKEPLQVAHTSGKTQLIVSNKEDKSFLSLQPQVLDFIHQFEKELNLDLTEVYEVENPPEDYKESGMVVYFASPRWMEAPPLLSLYTLLLRVGCVHVIGQNWLATLSSLADGTIKPYQRIDNNLVKRALPKIREIMDKGYRVMFFKDPKKNYPQGVDISVLHNSTGIVALAEAQTSKVVAHWTRPEIAKKPTLAARRAAKLNAASVGAAAPVAAESDDD